MSKAITLTGILIVLVLIVVLGQIPSGDVTDSKSAIKNAKQGLVTDTVVKAGGEAIQMTGNQAVDLACKDGASQGCSTTTTSVNMIGIVFTMGVIAIIIAGIIGLIKFTINVLESF
jgi:hypothetical protein